MRRVSYVAFISLFSILFSCFLIHGSHSQRKQIGKVVSPQQKILESKLITLKAKQKKLEAEIRKLVFQLKKNQKVLESTQRAIQGLLNKMKQMSQMLKSLRDALKLLRKQRKDLGQQIAEYKKDSSLAHLLPGLLESLRKTDANIEAKKGEIEKLFRDQVKLNKQISYKQKKQRSLLAQYARIKAELAAKQKELQKVKREIRMINRKLLRFRS